MFIELKDELIGQQIQQKPKMQPQKMNTPHQTPQKCQSEKKMLKQQGFCYFLGGTPYPSIAMPQLYNLLKEGYRMEAPHNCPEEIYGVMIMCWQEKPETRPQFQASI